MKRWTHLHYASLLTVALAAASPLGAQAADFDWSGEMVPGATLRVFTTAGTVTVREAAGREARVRGDNRYGTRQDIRYVSQRDGNDVRICALREESRCTDDGIRNDGRWRWGSDRRVRADLTVEVPRGVIVRVSSGNGDVTVDGATADVGASSGNGRVSVGPGAAAVRASTGNGTVSVDGARGPVRASSGNGRITVSTAMGPVEASTGNGNIDVTMDSLPRGGNMRFSSGNGRITLRAPADFSADILATTGNGGFETDFPMRLAGGISRNRLQGVIGGGDARIRISTGSGSVRLLRSGS